MYYSVENQTPLIILDSSEDEIIVDLKAEGASCVIYSMILALGDEASVRRQEVRHLAPRTQSSIQVKGILADTSSCTYTAKIHIANTAMGSVASERADFLLLSDDSKVVAQPDLEIQQKDVVCSHGVSITRLRPEKLFFLQSRGISEIDARELLIRAHIDSVFEEFDKRKQKIILTKMKEICA